MKNDNNKITYLHHLCIFYYLSNASVSIPSSVISIKSHAFYNCLLMANISYLPSINIIILFIFKMKYNLKKKCIARESDPDPHLGKVKFYH